MQIKLKSGESENPENRGSDNFIAKMPQVQGSQWKFTFFYLCIIVCSLAVKGKEYDFNIPKLYSISFLEFELDFGEGCTEVIQYLSLRNDNHPEVSYDILQMIYVILPRFKKKESECKTIMDKIIFSLKNGHKLKGVPKSFKEKELLQIFEVARISNFTHLKNCCFARSRHLSAL